MSQSPEHISPPVETPAIEVDCFDPPVMLAGAGRSSATTALLMAPAFLGMAAGMDPRMGGTARAYPTIPKRREPVQHTGTKEKARRMKQMAKKEAQY